MPYDHPASRLAVVDIGSNSVRMVIYDISHNPPIQVFNEKVFARLDVIWDARGCLVLRENVKRLKPLRPTHLLPIFKNPAWAIDCGGYGGTAGCRGRARIY